jgi:hypothetical protein
MTKFFIAMTLITAGMADDHVIDRVAVVVDNHVITQSELLREVRLTELMNGQPLDLGTEQRKTAADRLVDQQLIRNEMQIGSYPKPSPEEGDAMLKKFRQEHYASIPLYRAALEKYGVTEEELKQQLVWQLAAMRFTDLRFQVRPANTSVDQALDEWLKQQRSSTRIQFKKEAFEL